MSIQTILDPTLEFDHLALDANQTASSVCLSRRHLPPVRITSLELLLSPRQLCRSACRRETLLGGGISENHSEPKLDCTVGSKSVPIQKI
ncbi:hypothetical protein TNCV_1709361 [Trichonephila clavipes]|nr:hypothetical protein TNCV_1709361 [Trichonephila clavipes]